MDNQDGYQKAKKKVEAKLSFYVHLAVYIVVNVLLVLVNITTTPKFLWFPWPLFGWGIGLFFHGMGVFFFSEGSRIKERMIEKEMRRENLSKGGES